MSPGLLLLLSFADDIAIGALILWRRRKKRRHEARNQAPSRHHGRPGLHRLRVSAPKAPTPARPQSPSARLATTPTTVRKS